MGLLSGIFVATLSPLQLDLDAVVSDLFLEPGCWNIHLLVQVRFGRFSSTLISLNPPPFFFKFNQ